MSKKSLRPRASLPVRIILGVAAVSLLIVGSAALVNFVALTNYNQATQSLRTNIKASRRTDADFNGLYAKQQQVDAQFQEAASARILILPGLREAIDHNGATSRALTKYVLAKTKAQNGQQSGTSGTDDQTVAGQDTADAKTKSKSDLTEEQRQKVEDLLAQNTQSTQSDSSSSAKQKQNDSDSPTKPW